ncbi:MAG TPA: hypothetical protein VF476_00695 [Chitinophagaceae bacterium]
MINLIKKMKNMELNIKSNGLWLLLLLLVMTGCEHKKVILTPEGYDITKPDKIELGSKLDEISGIFWVNDTVMIANNDESGKIFAINLQDRKNYEYPNIKFGPKDDYEDIVKVGDTIFVLVSTGSIVKVTGYKTDSTIQAVTVATLPGKNEFESMYYDPGTHSLVMLCKTCHKEKDKIRSAYRFDLNTQTLIEEPFYRVDIDAIRTILDDSRNEFKPSAAAIHPIQQKIYMIASVGKVLVVTDKQGKVEQAIPISPTMFPQPEGLTFAPNGDLYISNEVATDERATILRFPFKQKQ